MTPAPHSGAEAQATSGRHFRPASRASVIVSLFLIALGECLQGRAIRLRGGPWGHRGAYPMTFSFAQLGTRTVTSSAQIPSDRRRTPGPATAGAFPSEGGEAPWWGEEGIEWDDWAEASLSDLGAPHVPHPPAPLAA